MKIIYTKEAEANMHAILEYIAQYDYGAAVTYTNTLKAKIKNLKEYPITWKNRP